MAAVKCSIMQRAKARNCFFVFFVLSRCFIVDTTVRKKQYFLYKHYLT